MNDLSKALKQSWMHRAPDGNACAVCGTDQRPLAYHVMQYAQDEATPLPEGFVPMSASRGTIRGNFPVCDECAPACDRCNLPIVTDGVKATYDNLSQRLHSEDTPLMWGNGICTHYGHHEVITADPILGSMISRDEAPPNHGDDFERKAAYIIAEREKAKQMGCTFNVVALVFGIIGWVVWEWYALPLVVVASIILGSIYSARKSVEIRKATGLTIDEQMEMYRRFSRK